MNCTFKYSRSYFIIGGESTCDCISSLKGDIYTHWPHIYVHNTDMFFRKYEVLKGHA